MSAGQGDRVRKAHQGTLQIRPSAPFGLLQSSEEQISLGDKLKMYRCGQSHPPYSCCGRFTVVPWPPSRSALLTVWQMECMTAFLVPKMGSAHCGNLAGIICCPVHTAFHACRAACQTATCQLCLLCIVEKSLLTAAFCVFATMQTCLCASFCVVP